MLPSHARYEQNPESGVAVIHSTMSCNASKSKNPIRRQFLSQNQTDTDIINFLPRITAKSIYPTIPSGLGSRRGIVFDIWNFINVEVHLLEKVQNSQQYEQTCKQGSAGVRLFAFDRFAAEFHKHVYELRGFEGVACCKPQTVATAIDATNSRFIIAPPDSCCQWSSSVPVLFISLKYDSMPHLVMRK